MAPVHAPVPGRGIPTNAASSTARDFSSAKAFSALDWARSRMGLSSFCTGPKRRAMMSGAMGSMFPATHKART